MHLHPVQWINCIMCAYYTAGKHVATCRHGQLLQVNWGGSGHRAVLISPHGPLSSSPLCHISALCSAGKGKSSCSVRLNLGEGHLPLQQQKVCKARNGSCAVRLEWEDQCLGAHPFPSSLLLNPRSVCVPEAFLHFRSAAFAVGSSLENN